MQNHQIRNIVFDLGGVILDIDPRLTINGFREMGWEAGNSDDRKTDFSFFYNLESGDESPETFRDNVRQKIGKPLSDKQIDDIWSAMVVYIPEERVRYLEQLKKDYRIFLLSNTNEIHRIKFHQMFDERFGYSFYDLFEHNFYSHEMGLRKPNPEIYLKALKLAKIKPDETLFIDDLEENVAAAESVGILGLHIQPGTLMEALPKYLENEV